MEGVRLTREYRIHCFSNVLLGVIRLGVYTLRYPTIYIKIYASRPNYFKQIFVFPLLLLMFYFKVLD